MGRGEVQSLLRMEALPSFFLLLLLTWTAEETFCKPAPGECMAWSWSSATGWKCTQEINTDPVDLDKFRQDSLAAHNAYRAKHGVAALKLNSKLNALAQEWADHLIAENAFEHRPNNANGENIYMSSGRAAQEQAQGAVDSWYSEIKDYTFGKEPSRGGPVTGHFTQVVWKGSTEVGVGVAQEGQGGRCGQLFAPWQLYRPVC